MPFIGNQLSTSFQNVETQTITGDGSTAYTLNNAVADGKDLLVYINNVKQEEGSGKSYTATGTTITFTEAVASTDSCYVVFIGQAVGTVTPKDGSIVSSMLADANLEMPNTLDLNGKELILDADADTSITADTDDTIDIKIAGSDVYQITATKIDLNGKELVLDADADTSITADTDDRVDIRIAGTDTVHIDASGIGVNINNPLYPLHVTEASGGDTAAIFIDGPTDGTSALFMGDSDDIDIGAIQYDHSSNYMFFRTNAAEAMRIDSDGDVGIGTGTASPSARLHTEVSRTTNFSASDYTTWADVLVRNNTNDDTCATGIGFINDGENYTNGASGIACLSGTGDTEGSLAFIVRPNGAVAKEAMRIDSSGNVLVATTDANPGNNSGGSDVGVVLDTNGKVLATTNNAEVMVLNRQNGDGDIAEFRQDGSPVGAIFNGGGNLGIDSDGGLLLVNDTITPTSSNDDTHDIGRSSARFDDIHATNGTIQTSDKNEKNTIVDSDLGIDFVNLLTPKSYKFNNKTRTHYGLIAQDVETVLGSIKKDASQFAGFCKDDISEKQDGSEYRYGLRYHEFISPMIQAIKDLKAEVDTLKAKVAALESK